MSTRRLIRTLLASAVLFASGAHAADVSVDPVRLHLGSTSKSQSLRLSNRGPEGARFQVKAFAWQQSPSGEMQLAPTTDLVFFPSLFELAAGDSRRIRVAATSSVGAVEKSYRLFIEELPPREHSDTKAIRVLTRLGLPVFLQPDAPRAKPLVRAQLERGRISAVLENGGNSYLVAQSVRVVARASDGAVLLEETLPGWYVLAGGHRAYEVAVPREICGRMSDLNVVAKTDHGTVRGQHKPSSNACTAP